MKKIKVFIIIYSILLMTQSIIAQTQRKNNCIFIEDKDEFLEDVKKSIQESEKKEEAKKKVPKMDLTGIKIPASPDEFTKCWFNPPIYQGLTGNCWSYSSVSFFESEIYRLHKEKVKLSEMYTVYWEYIEKALRYVETRGDSVFSKGSQPNATIRIWKQYGIVPAELYTGMNNKSKFLDQSAMYQEMKTFLESLKQNNTWNEEFAINTIKSILNHYMGAPPSIIKIKGKEMTPKQYLENILKLNLDDYVNVMSLKAKPSNEKVEYEVEDNWWHSKDYNNVSLDDFMKIIKTAIRKGYSVCIVGDTSESGYLPKAGVSMVPTYDIPSEYIDENARQIRFSNESTTDDHAIHLVGYLEKDGKDWYLIKDSGSNAQNSEHKGYFFFHEDYVKLKMMNCVVHKDIFNGIIKNKK